MKESNQNFVDLDALLADAERRFYAEECPALITIDLRDKLRTLKSQASASDWETIIQRAQSSQIFRIYQEDPICFRAHKRPRGYAGDADLLDMIYRRDHRGIHKPDVSVRGLTIFSAIASCNAPNAVRNRAIMTAAIIDRVLAKYPDAEVFSVACGHLEELNRSKRLSSSPLVRLTALDQDPLSIQSARARFLEHRIDYIESDVRALLRVSTAPGPFNLIYSTGLFDYLSDRFASRLIGGLATRLKSEGTLLVFNFHPGMVDDAFMDTIMDWRLVYRDSTALEKLAIQGLAEYSGFAVTSYEDSAGHLAVLEIRRI